LKKIIAFFVFSAIAGICFAADPVEGYWLSIDEKTGAVTAGWHIYQERGMLFGKIISMAEHPKDVRAEKCKDSYSGVPISGRVSQMFVVGTPWIFGLSPDKPGAWNGGSIINPEDGNMYKCKITYRPADGKKFKTDTLEVRGEIGLGIGRSQYWQKSGQEAASSLGPGL
jgi:uncharacterized protein (DUF2147 family)